MSAVAPTTVIEDALRLLHPAGEVFEVRIPKAGKAGTVSGYYTDTAKAAADIALWDGKAAGIYMTLNPVNPALMARSANRLKERAADTTSDRDVVCRRRLLIDVDFTRPAGISATDEELIAAGRKAQQIKAYLEDERDWPEGILVHSGNGAHLLHLIDLLNDDESRDLVKRCLAALAKKFDEGGVHVDTSVFNAARIVKVSGTMACKGDNLPERPHRRSALLTQPETPVPVPVSLLAALADTLEPEDKSGTFASGNGHGDFNVESFMARNGLVDRKHKQDHSGDLWELEICPFNPEHVGGEAWVRRDASGVLSAGCQHETCFSSWSELRGRFEPGYGVGKQGHRQEQRRQARVAEKAVKVAVPPYFHLTDTGNAERLTEDNVGELYHTPGYGFLSWDMDSGRFTRDAGAVNRRAKDTMRRIYAEAAEAIDPDLRKSIFTHAKRSESAAARQAMLRLAECEWPLQAKVEDLDADHMLLNTLSGVVDLATGDLHEHDPKYRMTHVAGAAYDPKASCPLWLAHLERVFAGDETLVDFFHRLCGYALTGLTIEQCLAILHGIGANGKSVTVETLRAAAGDYAMTADFSAFSVRRSDGPRNDLARLAGARIVTAAETSSAQKLDEAVVKQATGGEPVAARFLYGESFEYQPQFTLFLSTNHRPEIAGTDHGIWRRVRLIPFDVVIPDNEQDHNLIAKLRGELPGILAWMVRGCLEWQKRGLTPPTRVREATDAYRVEMDSLGAFVADHLIEDSNAAVAAGAVYKTFSIWAEKNHEKVISLRAFSARLAERGVKVSAREPGSGRHLYVGFRLECFTDEGRCEPSFETGEAL